MEINKLRTFIDLAETLSFSKTAENLYITQSSVSKHIKSLEKEIGHHLFLRTNKQVELSSYGQVVLPYAKQILFNYDQMSDQLLKFNAQKASRLRLGTIPTFANYDAFQKATYFMDHHPNFTLTFHECETSQVYQLLDKKEIDAAFIRSLTDLPAIYETIEVKEESFRVFVASDDPLVQKDIVNVSDLKERAFLSLTEKSLLQEPMIELCRQSGFEPRITFVSSRVSSILNMIKNKQGIAILMDSPSLENGVKAIPIYPTRQGKLLFVKRKDHHNRALNTFWQFLKKEYHSISE
ncbi:LysR family transcriptional regulator [Lactobacillus sp.]|uniref:LysR family transcriptional regulator n=1 Tax=Lactobacillus sp. TaxID=1591 RepID=UPI00199678E2|nr:LysR family transcriptional regulator [Lactobacillus sp.]MBD5429125.1 LysR family transcriptional regulator [Lactobacillus sp.]